MTPETTTDLDLIQQVRQGDNAGFHLLYERHSGAARNLARHLTRDPNVADDLVSEAFTKVLQAIRSNGGPEHAFRTYLLTTLRNTAYEQGRRDKRITFVDDYTAFEQGDVATDSANVAPDRSLITDAYRRLPERWRMVLWYTEVEGYRPAAVASLMGMTPNGVAALSYRAREGLRQAYLRAHVTTVETDRCRASVDRLGAWARNALARRERAQLEAHLDNCARCRALAAELTEINAALPGLVAVAVLGVAGVGYLATAPAASASGVLAGVAAVAGVGGEASKGASTQLVGASLSGLAMAVTTVVGMSTTSAPQAIAAPTQEPVSVRQAPDAPPAAPAVTVTPTPAPPVAPKPSTSTRPPTTPPPSTTASTTPVPSTTASSTAASSTTASSTAGSSTTAPSSGKPASVPAPTTTQPPQTTEPPDTAIATAAEKPAYLWTFTTTTARKSVARSTLTITVPGDAEQLTPVVVDVTPPKYSVVRSHGCDKAGGALRCTGTAGAGRDLVVRLEITSLPGYSPTARVTLTAADQVVTRSVRLR